MKTIVKFGICTLAAIIPMHSAYAEAYAGAALGYAYTTISKDISYNSTDTDNSDHYNAFRGLVLVGYNFRNLRTDVFGDENASPSDLFFGIEADFAYTDDKAEADTQNWFLDVDAKVSEKVQYQADLFLLGKYAIQPKVLLFFGPGVSVGNLKVESNGVTAGDLGITGSESSSVSGWSLKMGLEAAFCDNMSLVAAYQYTDLGATSWTATEPLTGDLVHAKYHPIINSITIGVNFA